MGLGLGTKAVVKTISGTAAQTFGTGLVPSGSIIQADTGVTAYIGGAGVSSTTGFLIPTTPMKLGDILSSGMTNDIDLSEVYVIGSDTNKIRLLYLARV